MKKSNNKGYLSIDMAVAIVAIIVFSGLIISLMYVNFLGNTKTKKEAVAMIYLTELMENIGIAKYDEVIQENIEELKPVDLRESSESNQVYKLDINIEEIKPNEELKETADIIKKITATISYTVADKTYSNTLERIKIKE